MTEFKKMNKKAQKAENAKKTNNLGNYFWTLNATFLC